MSEIPKRPNPTGHGDGYGRRWSAERLAHEHAVAKVAVEALREHNCYCVASDLVCHRCVALAKIEASGWAL